MVWHESRAGLRIIGIGVAGTCACAALDEDLVAAFNQLISSRRQKGDAIFLAFDFSGDTDNHGAEISSVSSSKESQIQCSLACFSLLSNILYSLEGWSLNGGVWLWTPM